MKLQRLFLLTSLALLTVFFLGAAYLVWQDETPTLTETPSQTVQQQPAVGATADVTPTNVEALSLAIAQTGIQSVTLRQLQSHQMPVETMQTTPLSLTYQGRPVPYMLAGEGENETLYFYAEAITDTLKGPPVYRLQIDEPGLMMQQRNAAPRGELAEPNGQQTFIWNDNRLFTDHAPGNDMWMGELLFAGKPWELELTDVEVDGTSAELVIRVLSNTKTPDNPDHHVEIAVNHRIVGNHSWDGISYETIRLPLADGVLNPNQPNTITVSIPSDVAGLGASIYIDSVELNYTGPLTIAERQKRFESQAATVALMLGDGISAESDADLMVFDITNPDQPVFLNEVATQDGLATFSSPGSRFVAVLAGQAIQPQVSPVPTWDQPLRDATRGADYIAIVPRVNGFSEAIQPLLRHREQQGLRVSAVALEQIYDEFSYGQESPDAIRAFLQYTAEQWQSPAPRFVLLVGDATSDIRNLSIGQFQNHIPTPLVSSSIGRAASDSWYTWDTDNQPQMAIGRFPAQSADEIQTFVSKTLNYENAISQNASWTHQALLVADDQPQFDVATHELSDALTDQGYSVYSLHMSEDSDVRYRIMSAINQGVGLVNYTGDGSERMWGDERVLDSADVAMLSNSTRLPLLTTFTTRNGAFADPLQESLAETLLQNKGGGVVAAIAPSGNRHSPMQVFLAQEFYAALLDESNESVGEALLQLQQRAAINNSAESGPTTAINLLGDPALRFQTPAADPLPDSS